MSESARLHVIVEGLTILVVDDDVGCRDAFRYMLEALGATVGPVQDLTSGPPSC